MIIDDIKHYQRYQAVEGIGVALEAIYQEYQGGQFPLTDRQLTDTIQLNSVSFQSRLPEVISRFENHHQWLDIHFIFTGTEQVLVAEAAKLSVSTEYCKENDIEFLTGEESVRVALQPGQFLVCYPGEAHCVGVSTNLVEGERIEKIVSKINLSDYK